MDAFTYKDISILYEDNHLLVVEKPVNLIMQADSTNDIDLLSLMKEYLKETYQKPGNVYLGLVHRLDRPVGGVCVFAKTSKAASRLSDQIRTHTFQKTYQAVLEGNSKSQDTLVDYLVKDSKTNTTTVTSSNDSNGKKAILHYRTLSQKESLSLVEIQLETGRSHQIRVQFSSRDIPLWGDQRYNKNAKVKQQIALWATRIIFQHPTTKEIISFMSNVPNQYPWNRFE